MSFVDQVRVVPVDIPDDPRPKPPRLYWFNGDKRSKTPGVFHIKHTELGEPPAQPWKVSDRFDGEVGYQTKSLDICVIGLKTQPFISERDGTREVGKRWLTKWVKGAQLYTEVLALVEGIDGAVTWNSKGLTGKAFSSILRIYQTALLRQAESIAGQKLPLWSFWLPIGSAVDDDGKTIFADTGFGSYTTPPALHLPDMPINELVERLFVGADYYAECDRIRKENASWLKESYSTEDTQNDYVADAGDNFATVARSGHARVDPASAAEVGYELSGEVEVPFNGR